MKTREVLLHDHRQKAALLEIEADLDNIRVAWNYWIEQAGRRPTSRVCSKRRGLFFEVRGSFAPAIQFYGDAATEAQRRTNPTSFALAQSCGPRQAWFTALVGSPDEGLQMALESINTLRQYAVHEITVRDPSRCDHQCDLPEPRSKSSADNSRYDGERCP